MIGWRDGKNRARLDKRKQNIVKKTKVKVRNINNRGRGGGRVGRRYYKCGKKACARSQNVWRGTRGDLPRTSMLHVVFVVGRHS